MERKPKYLIRINSGCAINNGNILPFREKYIGRLALIDPNEEMEHDPTDYINEEACEAYHPLHYHAEGIIFDENGVEDLEAQEDGDDYVDICLECCEDYKDN